MKLLAIDTATEACSAALSFDGEITERYTFSPRKHTMLILPMIDELMVEAGLKPQQLDALAFGCGPGSFTGVRIATGIIQGIAYAHDLPVAPISNLAAVAQDFFDRNEEDIAFVAMDARMNEIYWGTYQRNADNLAELTGEERVIPAQKIEFQAASGVGIGSGWATYARTLKDCLGDKLIRYESDDLPHAATIAKLGTQAVDLGRTVPPEQALPVYLRNNVAKKESER